MYVQRLLSEYLALYIYKSVPVRRSSMSSVGRPTSGVRIIRNARPPDRWRIEMRLQAKDL